MRTPRLNTIFTYTYMGADLPPSVGSMNQLLWGKHDWYRTGINDGSCMSATCDSSEIHWHAARPKEVSSER